MFKWLRNLLPKSIEFHSVDQIVLLEGVEGRWHYHLGFDKPHITSLCGETHVMGSSAPLDSWGYRGHLNETYCDHCTRLGRELNVIKK